MRDTANQSDPNLLPTMDLLAPKRRSESEFQLLNVTTISGQHYSQLPLFVHPQFGSYRGRMLNQWMLQRELTVLSFRHYTKQGRVHLGQLSHGPNYERQSNETIVAHGSGLFPAKLHHASKVAVKTAEGSLCVWQVQWSRLVQQQGLFVNIGLTALSTVRDRSHELDFILDIPVVHGTCSLQPTCS